MSCGWILRVRPTILAAGQIPSTPLHQTGKRIGVTKISGQGDMAISVQSIFFSLTSRQDVQLLAVLGDRAASDVDAVLLEFHHQQIITERMGLVFGLDDLLQFGLHRAPTHGVARIGLRAAGEEHSQGKDTAR